MLQVWTRKQLSKGIGDASDIFLNKKEWYFGIITVRLASCQLLTNPTYIWNGSNDISNEPNKIPLGLYDASTSTCTLIWAK